MPMYLWLIALDFDNYNLYVCMMDYFHDHQ